MDPDIIFHIDCFKLGDNTCLRVYFDLYAPDCFKKYLLIQKVVRQQWLLDDNFCSKNNLSWLIWPTLKKGSIYH